MKNILTIILFFCSWSLSIAQRPEPRLYGNVKRSSSNSYDMKLPVYERGAGFLTELDYDEKGQCVNSSTTYKELTRSKSWTFDSLGRFDFCVSEGFLGTTYIEYSFNENNNLIEVKETSGDSAGGQLISLTSHSYTGNLHEVYNVGFKGDTTGIEQRYSNSKGKDTLVKFFNGEGLFLNSQRYSYSGDLVMITRLYDLNNVFKNEIVDTYDTNGLWLERVNKDIIYDFEIVTKQTYSFDKSGNWTENWSFRSGEIVRWRLRHIYYYE